MKPIVELQRFCKLKQIPKHKFSLLFTVLSVLLTSMSLSLVSNRAAFGLDQETWLLLTEPLDRAEVNRLRSGSPAPKGVVAANTVSQTRLTVPSLWWADQQFGGNLVNFWVAYTGNGTPPHVDLLVDQQVWTTYDYLERYAFVNQFGTAASDFGFHTRVFDWQGQLLGAYICDFNQAQPTSTRQSTVQTYVSKTAVCNVFLDPSGPGAFRGGTNPLGGVQPLNGGTGR